MHVENNKPGQSLREQAWFVSRRNEETQILEGDRMGRIVGMRIGVYALEKTPTSSHKLEGGKSSGHHINSEKKIQ